MKILVGGIGQLYQGDYDLGRRAVGRLSPEDLGPGVTVEELLYGAVAVSQRLEDLRPDALVLVGAEARGRPPGTVERRRLVERASSPDQVRLAVEAAASGSVSIDLLEEVGRALRALPARTVAIEVEPAFTDPSEQLSPQAARGLEGALQMVRREVALTPLFELGDRLRETLREGRIEASPALGALEDLLDELEVVEANPTWGMVFPLRDELRSWIARGEIGHGMRHDDWAMWWAIIEELDRLQRADSQVAG